VPAKQQVTTNRRSVPLTSTAAPQVKPNGTVRYRMLDAREAGADARLLIQVAK